MPDHPTAPVRPLGIYLLPNLFTTLSLFSGFYAIIASTQGNFEAAYLAIFIGMICDSLDGRVARLTNTQTAFGAQYDSLSDLVSFGIAPAVLTYNWALHLLGKPGWLAAFVYSAAVALRLARFNTQLGSVDKRYFQGLPCPPAAGVVAAAIACCLDYQLDGQDFALAIAMLMVFLAAVMVSNIRYRSFKDLDFKNKVPFVTILALVMIIVGIAIAPPQVLFLGLFSYALAGPITTLSRLREKRLQRRAFKHEQQ